MKARIRHAAALAALLLSGHIAVRHVAAQELLLYEPFDYPGDEALNAQADWDGDAPVEGLQVLNGDAGGDDGTSSLQFVDLPGRGGRVKSTAGFDGESLILLPAPITGEGSVLYVSFLYKPLVVGNSYFAHNRTTGSVQGQLGRWETKPDNTPNTTFAARWRDSSTRVLEQPPGHESGTTLFVVAKTTLVPGVDNDTFDLWTDVEPGELEFPPTVSATSLTGAGNDIDPAVGILGFRLRVRGNTGEFEIDELRMGTTWASVTTAGGSAVCSARRTIDPAIHRPGENVSVTVSARGVPGETTITETIPGGWTVANAGTGTVEGDAITFTVTADGEVAYELTAPDSCGDATIAGRIAAAGGCDDEVGGDSILACVDPVSLPFYEPFDYPDGTALSAQRRWAPGAPVEGLRVINGDDQGDEGTSSLSFPPLPGEGGRVRSTQGFPGASGVLLDVPVTDEGSEFYVSFLYKPIAPGDSYFAHNNTSGSVQGQLGRWDSKPDNDPATTFVARWRDGSTRVFEDGFGHESGKTVFVVARTTMVEGPDNDTFELWINPEPGDPEPPASATAFSLLDGGNDIDPSVGIVGFTLRVSRFTGEFEIDELRMGTSWESVTTVVEPEVRFVRGDADSDGTINLTDGIVILNFLFLGAESPACMDAADADDDGGERPQITDAIVLFTWLFLGGVAPSPPSPATAAYGAGDCGVDPTADDPMGCLMAGALCQ
ncbi:MAG: hypothetical protein O7J95_13220 [Planctomycetota bacterium]|nr:hypothetical protein [Planctomycetota bacterium]